MQPSLIRAEAEKWDDRPTRWLHYVRWFEEVINREITARTAKYVKITA